MSNPNNFVITSEYPSDKVVWFDEGVADSSNPYWNYEEVFPYIKIPTTGVNSSNQLLIDGVWTTDDWVTCSPITSEIIYKPIRLLGSYTLQVDRVECQPDIYEGYIYFRPVSESGNTIKYRLWGYYPEDNRELISQNKTAQQQYGGLQKNSDLNYSKILAEAKLVARVGETAVYRHNLGYKPLIQAWIGSETITEQTYGLTPYNGWYGDLRVTDTTIEWTYTAEFEPTSQCLVRIYSYEA